MQEAYRIGATLETIPTELRLMIAAHLDPDVPLDLRWSGLAQQEAQRRRATLASLPLVSRSWAEALAGQRWQVRRTLRGGVAVPFITDERAEVFLLDRCCTFALQTPNAYWNSPATGCLGTERKSSLS